MKKTSKIIINEESEIGNVDVEYKLFIVDGPYIPNQVDYGDNFSRYRKCQKLIAVKDFAKQEIILYLHPQQRDSIAEARRAERNLLTKLRLLKADGYKVIRTKQKVECPLEEG